MLATTEQKHNFFNLYADVFWWGILAGSTLGFLNIYATRLGANSYHIGLLTAGPAVVSLFVPFDIRIAIFVGGALRLLAALLFTRWG